MIRMLMEFAWVVWAVAIAGGTALCLVMLVRDAVGWCRRWWENRRNLRRLDGLVQDYIRKKEGV